MFKLEGNLTFINIDQSYLTAMHDACSEVYYKPANYANKPYLGILLNNNDRRYVIPFTSAKPKHRNLKNFNNGCFLIYETVGLAASRKSGVWTVGSTDDTAKHIIAVLDIKKMIPIIDNVYSVVDLNTQPTDTIEDSKYKMLLNKEYSFCLKIIPEILRKADSIYSKQLATGKVQMFCCDFRLLEDISDSYASQCAALKQ